MPGTQSVVLSFYRGITGTNENPGYYGDAGHHYLSFADRCLPSDAIVPNSLRPGCWGIAWEMVIQASQATGRGVWINAPVSATLSWPANETSYVYEWATLMRDGNAATGNKGIPSGAPIYIEHSNEVSHEHSFPSFPYILSPLFFRNDVGSHVSLHFRFGITGLVNTFGEILNVHISGTT